MRVVYLNRQNSHYSCKKFMFAKVENVVRVGLVGNFLCLCRNLEKKIKQFKYLFISNLFQI